MKSTTRRIAVCGAAFLALVLVVADATARVGGGGSRGMRSFGAPAATKTAPTPAQPLQRTQTQRPTAPVAGAPAGNTGGMLGRSGGFLGGGLMGGLAAGFLGAGLFGMLAGNGFMGGLAGFASFLGLLLQVGLVALLAMFAWRWFQRRQEPAVAGGPSLRDMTQNRSGLGNLGLGGGLGSTLGGLGGGAARASSGPSDDIGIAPADYDAFEGLLQEIQTAYSREDVSKLRTYATSEMVSYFEDDLAENASRGVINRVSDVKLLQGDLAEAWREGSMEYASVAMRFSLVDQLIDRATDRVVQGDDRPQEVTEVWTFVRPRGGNWVLSAIQQA
jgi:predicted lipid-binding transport protein (Tim44 family)